MHGNGLSFGMIQFALLAFSERHRLVRDASVFVKRGVACVRVLKTDARC